MPNIALLAGRAEKVFVAFNNHYQAKAVTNAKMLRRMLEKAGIL